MQKLLKKEQIIRRLFFDYILFFLQTFFYRWSFLYSKVLHFVNYQTSDFLSFCKWAFCRVGEEAASSSKEEDNASTLPQQQDNEVEEGSESDAPVGADEETQEDASKPVAAACAAGSSASTSRKLSPESVGAAAKAKKAPQSRAHTKKKKAHVYEDDENYSDSSEAVKKRDDDGCKVKLEATVPDRISNEQAAMLFMNYGIHQKGVEKKPGTATLKKCSIPVDFIE